MRYSICFIFLLMLILCNSTAQAENPADEGVKKFIKNWAEAFNKNDTEKHVEFYDQSDKTEMVISAGMRHKGIKEIRTAYEKDQKEIRYSDSSIKIKSIRVLGETALISFEHKFRINVISDKSKWQVHIRTTTVLHKIKNQWKIVLEHSSPIQGIDRIQAVR